MDGSLKPLPFEKMINPATGRMRPRKVDIDGETYECARRYMIRLERPDFEEPQLSKLARSVNLTPAQFRQRFGYLAGMN